MNECYATTNVLLLGQKAIHYRALKTLNILPLNFKSRHPYEMAASGGIAICPILAIAAANQCLHLEEISNLHPTDNSRKKKVTQYIHT